MSELCVDVTVRWGDAVVAVHRRSRAGAITFACLGVAHPSLAPSDALVVFAGTSAVVHAAHGAMQLGAGQRCTTHAGPLTIVVEVAERTRVAPTVARRDLDWMRSVAFAFTAQLAFVASLCATAHAPSLVDDFALRSALPAVLVATHHVPRAATERPRATRPRHVTDDALFREHGAVASARATAARERERARDRERATAALAALGLHGPGSAASSAFGPAGLAAAIENELAEISGASVGGASDDVGDASARSTGGGAGGAGLGIGALGSGTGLGWRGHGEINLLGRGNGTSKFVPGKVLYIGTLSREEIQRVISRVMSQIKYCYENELTADPILAGRIVVAWTIAGSGDVENVRIADKTLAGPRAEPVGRCVTQIIERLKFPQPRGGGQVTVTYPFAFDFAG